ncbi:DUF4382 domain-containing protein [Flammeovirga sp. SubArs3]|uniref:DUF4382 domain-containing protein n=1 Tax=Flammeovirga sp. SubArs3 TaxID=2995316 RepID=UPI00248CD7EB|nr:DUF4382 domain-containing protein [Flammeovirga sp. SubArs3]
MKKTLLTTLAFTTILFASCNKDESEPTNNASTGVSLQVSDFQMEGESSARIQSESHPSLEGIDSVIVAVESLELAVDGVTVLYTQNEGEGYIDLLSFQSTDTLMWTEENLPAGTIDENATLHLVKFAENQKVVEEGNVEAALHVSHEDLDFTLTTDSENGIEANQKYVLKLDMAGSLRLVHKGNEGYNLQQGTKGAEKTGSLILQKVSDDNENLPE